MARSRQAEKDPLLRELDSIKRLLMLQLVTDGVPAVDVALVLGITKSAMSAILPTRRLLSLKKDKE